LKKQLQSKGCGKKVRTLSWIGQFGSGLGGQAGSVTGTVDISVDGASVVVVIGVGVEG